MSGIKAKTMISGKRGLIPIPIFADKAFDVGFVDFDPMQVPLVETYQSRTVKSLLLCSLELSTGEKAVFNPGKKLVFGKQELALDEKNSIVRRLPSKDDLTYVPFNQFLTGKIPASLVEGKVIIIGYDGAKMHSLPTSIGPIRAHRIFVYDLKNAYEKLTKF